jgi:hypothetical protein
MLLTYQLFGLQFLLIFFLYIVVAIQAYSGILRLRAVAAPVR